MISDNERDLAEQVIKLHDGKNYILLQEMSIPPSVPDDEARITEDMYLDMCKDIEQELGVIDSIEFIDCLLRKSSKLTLWKVKYRKSEDEVFWAIGFDLETVKVQDVLINW